jgi:hypothetical protein
MRRALLVGTIGSLLIAVAAATLLEPSRAAPKRPGALAQRLLLRLHDLPPGYVGNLVSSETGPLDECGYLKPAEAEPELAAFIARYAPKGCSGIYFRLYTMPGFSPAPPAVGSGALDAGSVDAAEAGLAVAPEAIGHLTEGMKLEEVAPPAIVGEATRLFHWTNGGGAFVTGKTSDSFLAWRSDSTVGVIFVEGRSFAASDQIAIELARRQQVHIEQPTPYTRAERDSSEVALDNPILKVRAYWLGRTFRPGNGTPPSRLRGTFSIGGKGVASRQSLTLAYSGGITLREWARGGWKRFSAAHPDDEFAAIAQLGGTVIAVESRRYAAKDIVRGLHPRPKRAF